MKHVTFSPHMIDGSHVTLQGIRFRLTVEGKHRFFVVHPSVDFPDHGYFSVSEESTRRRVTTLSRLIRDPKQARGMAIARVQGLLEQGLGPQIAQKILKYAKEKA